MTQTQDQPNRRTYRGSCHCGAFIYEIDLPELSTIVECDCSFCRRTGNLYVPTSEDANFRVVNGSEEHLKSYTFGPGSKIHKFCPICATSILSRMPNGPAYMKLVLNARALQYVDVYLLERRYIFNSKVGAQYQPPKHKGDMPRIVEGGKLYTGSCHCGAVTVALSCRPLQESSEGGVIVCNCHICQRVSYAFRHESSPPLHSKFAIQNAYVWLFPEAENMVLSGSNDDIGRYTFSGGLASKTFCRTCGVGMTRPQPVEDRDQAPSESSCRAYRRGDASHPVNARVLHGVDVSKLRRGSKRQQSRHRDSDS
ncbi:glutathione-dependent formaldehyde-activating enzyme [Trichoderma gracile]